MEDGQALAPANSSNEDETHVKAQEFKNSGNDKFNKSNYKGAIVDYKKGLLHEPNNPDLHANLSAAYIHLEKYLDAEEHAVYAIQLRPTFYKGYMRGAKAAHGKGMTTLALNRLKKGLTLVTDPNGIRELNRLKTQYTAYLSLKSNAERQMDFSSDRYLSEDEDEELYSDNDEHFYHELPQDENITLSGGASTRFAAENFLQTLKSSDDTKFDKSAEQAVEPNKTSTKVNESSKTKALSGVAKVAKHMAESAALSEKLEQRSKKAPAKDEEKKVEVARTTRQKSTENNGPLDKKDNSQEKQSDRFLELCKELTKDPELNKHIEEFKEHLKTGSKAFLSGNFRKAAESWKAAKERVGLKLSDYEIDDRQFHVIKYAHSAALINLGSYDDLVKAIQALVDMETYKFLIPALYVQLARAYCKLNRFKIALEPLEKLQDILDNFPIFPTFTWPGTTETIQETTPAGLKDAVKELNQLCRMSHKPTAVCRYDHCLRTSTHMLPSELIYNSDPDFIGFVRMVCEERCHIEFHVACWKSYKESIIGVGKINDKDFLGRRCLTTDCVNGDGEPSIITVIEIVGADGQVKSVNKLDPKTNVDSKKAKKRRCKLDDKERVVKAKRPKEKKVREVKKPATAAEEEDEAAELVRTCTDPAKVLQSRTQCLKELRAIRFGVEKSWDPKSPYYGRPDEMQKWVEKCENESSCLLYLDYGSEESIDVKDAKEFIFSYFMEILKLEGPLKQADVEDLWKQVAEDFCNIKVVLPNLKSMCELLIESSCFCQLEDYICLAGQLDSAYETVNTEVAETVKFLMTGSTDTTGSAAAQSQLPDLLHHPQSTSTNQVEFISQSTSEDESSESEDEYNSPVESEESDEETSGEIEEHIKKILLAVSETEDKIKFVTQSPKQFDDEDFSLQKVLDEMSRVKNMFIKTASPESSKTEIKDINSNRDRIESPNNETFETARGSSQNMSDDDKVMSDSSNEEHENNMVHTDDYASDLEGTPDTVISYTPDQAGGIDDTIEGDKVKETEEVTTDKQVFAGNPECDKASQSGVPTEERHMQTAPLETKDTLSQTKESEMYKELNEKVQELTKQMSSLSTENSRLAKEVIGKETLHQEIKKAQAAIAQLREENIKADKKCQDYIENAEEEFSKKEAGFKQTEQELTKEVMNLKEIYFNLVVDNQKLNNGLSSLAKDKMELEANQKTLEKNLKTKILNSQKAQLLIIKAFWENQVNLLGKRCVEKISEMHSWFSLLPSGEVEELPSWRDVRQITMQWGEISSKIQQIQIEFQMKYTDLENRLSRGEEVDDLSSLTLPTLPDEPNPLPLDKIHKEITDKHTKRISELTQLVANQQLEIEKSKDSSQQVQKLMNSYQMTPRMQTTAFGSLALQYTYPQAITSPYGSTLIPTIPPNQDISKIGGASKPLQADVQTLLQESSAVKFRTSPEKTSLIGTSAGSSAFSSPFLSMPPPSMMAPPSVGITPPVGLTPSVGLTPPVGLTTPVGLSPSVGLTPSVGLPSPVRLPSPVGLPFAVGHPPPPVGVAHNLLKASTALAEKKDKKPVEQPAPPKPEPTNKASSSRESTPIPASTPTPTPEKAKKKKKSKDRGEVKAPTPVPAAEAKLPSMETDTTPWSVAINKKAIQKHVPQLTAPVADSRLKNKRKLLDKLQLKFSTTPLKDLDEIVKLVREMNNGSLSGLPFEEIETRVERFITKKHFQKSTTMGLVKFTDAAWGPVKQQEPITWTNLQLEECTICLEPMGKDRTKVDCNHEFHTKCLRKWLKEKSVCPLCNKFTTMPDEFPAL